MKNAALFLITAVLAQVTLAADSEIGVLTPHNGEIGISHTLYAREFVLSRNHPYSEELKITFLGISNDGYASVRLDTGIVVRAKKGEAFSCEEFGRSGLVYISSPRNRLGIRLMRLSCETTEIKNEPNQ